jgi:hypothetical protein
LFTLGLGGTTPLPQWVFGDWWRWLTYERYAIWASLLLIPLAVSLLSLQDIPLSIKSFRSPRVCLLFVAVVAMCTASSFLATEPVRKTYYPSPPPVDVTGLAGILEREDIGVGSNYYYLTLGFGEAQFEKLSTQTSARSLDGTYYTARTLPVLRESGIASLDASKYFDPELSTLKTILKDAPQYNLKLVLVNDVFYDDVLGENGFTLRWSARSLGNNYLGSVTIWEREDIPPITAPEKHETGLWTWVWGIAPLSMLAALLLVLLLEIRSGFRKERS